MTAQVHSEALTFVWTANPDAAVESGNLPPARWPPIDERSRRDLLEQSDDILAKLDLAFDDPATGVAKYHVRCARADLLHRDLAILNHMTGPAAQLSWASESWPIAKDPDGAAYLARLQAFGPYCEQVTRMAANSPGRTSAPVLRAFLTQLEALVQSNQGKQKSILAPLEAIGRPCPPAIISTVLSGLDALREIARKALGSASEGSSLVSSGPDRGRYLDCIYAGTSRPLNARSVEELGTSLLHRTQAEFERLEDAVSGTPDRFRDGGQYLDTMREIHAELNARLPRAVTRVPQMPCRVREMPDAHSAVGPPAYYGPSSRDSRRPGLLYVNTSSPVATRIWEALPLAMHEGVPGHHLQIALADENDSLPELLRHLSVNAFTEGWAVYAETLASALDFEVTPTARFGLLAHQRWRAARLVVDVGLHQHGWSVDRAVQFMVDRTALDPDAVRREVVRYLAWPGQALGYAVGATTIAAWVDKQRSEGVSLAAAHDELLAMGSVPLAELSGESMTSAPDETGDTQS